jgi:hypothetical protein
MKGKGSMHKGLTHKGHPSPTQKSGGSRGASMNKPSVGDKATRGGVAKSPKGMGPRTA